MAPAPTLPLLYANLLHRHAFRQIARLIGRDKNSRLVGKVLSMAEYYGDYPCHRVVNHAGRLVPGWLEQRLLLEAEQVVMKDDRHVDLKKCRWDY